MNNSGNNITCLNCNYSADKKIFIKSCGNCFACTGCEVYICPECSSEITIKAIDNRRSFRKLNP